MGISIPILKERAALLQAIRSFFVEQSFLEVETPIRIPAPAPEAYIEPQRSDDWFLQTSPELCMKRLLASGLSTIFQICKCFRKNERGQRHLPEMTMLEWYRTGTDYTTIMEDCEALLHFLVPSKNLVIDDKTINIERPWQRLPLRDAFSLYSQVSLETALGKNIFEEILVEDIEPRLGVEAPIFLIDYPAEMASLARLDPGNHDIAQRFELYIDGIELANGFSELNNPDEQRNRFKKEIEIIQRAGGKPSPMPESFLLELGSMPDAAGIALGVDRLVMLLTNTKDISDCVTFTPESL